jgi:hypothetical protein
MAAWPSGVEAIVLVSPDGPEIAGVDAMIVYQMDNEALRWVARVELGHLVFPFS